MQQRREIFVWTRLYASSYLSLRESLFSAPTLPGLEVSAHYDASAGVVLLGLVFVADHDLVEELLAWALRNDLGVIQPGEWSSPRRMFFARDTYRFRCSEDGDPAHRPLLNLVRQFETRRRGPVSVEVACDYAEELARLAEPSRVRRRFARASPAPAPRQDGDLYWSIARAFDDRTADPDVPLPSDTPASDSGHSPIRSSITGHEAPVRERG